MTYFTRYIFSQLFFTVFVTTLVLTGIMWLAQSLRYISFLANKGAPVFLFCEMVFYLLPNLVVIIAPIAVLIGIIFVYNKLIVDHELIAMQASGLGYWKLASPALLVSCLVTCFLYLFTLYLLPLSFRKFRDISISLKEKSFTSAIQVGQFNTIGRYMVYVRSQDSQGNYIGVLIYDGNLSEKSKIYMSEKGILLNDAKGGRLLLITGSHQETDEKTGKPAILYFDRYIIEATDKMESEEKEGRNLKAYERYLRDLLNPPKDISITKRLEFLSAAHQRLISPLYAFVFGLLAVCSMILGQYNRKGRTFNILIACVLSLVIEIFSLVFMYTLKYSSLMITLTYGLIFCSITICCFLLTAQNRNNRIWSLWRNS